MLRLNSRSKRKIRGLYAIQIHPMLRLNRKELFIDGYRANSNTSHVTVKRGNGTAVIRNMTIQIHPMLRLNLPSDD